MTKADHYMSQKRGHELAERLKHSGIRSADVARSLNVSEGTVYQWRKRGSVPSRYQALVESMLSDPPSARSPVDQAYMDKCAIAVLPELIRQSWALGEYQDIDYQEVAETAYGIAKAMLDQRSK